MMEDWQLLEDYVRRGSESAFRSLVSRHLGLVYAAAFRHVNDSGLAEEISQAVFILLARKARSLPRRTILAGWLFRTTRFVASRAVRSEVRRQRREQQAVDMQQLSLPDETWRRIAPDLDQALERLGAAERHAVLLRFLEDKNHRQVGAALGISEEAAKKRVSRGLDKLRAFFAARGFTVSAAALATVLTANAAKAPAAALVSSVASAALAGGGAAITGLPVLARETLARWYWLKMRLAGVLATAGIVIVLLVGSAMLRRSGEPMPAPSPALANATQAGDSAKSSSFQASAGKNRPRTAITQGVLRLHVVAADTGEAVGRAALMLNIVAKGEWTQRYGFATDDAGWAELPFPADASRLDVSLLSWGWAARYVTWTPARDDKVPAEYTLRVERQTNSMGGWLRDEQDHPVSNGEILLESQNSGDHANRERPRELAGVPRKTIVARSDKNGWWSCAVIPPENNGGFVLTAEHPEFRSTRIESSSADGNADTNRESLKQLWSGALITRLDRGATLTGRVMDESGQPIAGAQVVHAPHTFEPIIVATDAEGRFSLPKLEERFDFTVTATGFAPEYRALEMQRGTTQVEVRLKPGGVLRIRTVDEGGLEVPGVTIGLEQWGALRHRLKWSAETGPDGNLEWASAPRDEELLLYGKRDGWCYTRDIRVHADGEEHVVAMRRVLQVTGLATDAGTGETVGKVKAFPGYGDGQSMWERLDTRQSGSGTFKVRFEESTKPWRVRVEAEGYEPWVSEPLPADFAGILEASLNRFDTSRAVRGTVLLPDGQPAAGAQIALLTLEHNVTLVRMRFREQNDPLVVKADRLGRFSFSPDPKAHSVAAVSEAGFARLRLRQFDQPLTVRLQPWGRIEGVVRIADLPAAAKVVLLDMTAMQQRGAASLGFDHGNFRVNVGREGTFVIEAVPAGKFDLLFEREIGIPLTHQTLVEVHPGQTTQAQIGGTGRTVIGRLTAESSQAKNWAKEVRHAALNVEPSPVPRPPGLAGDALALWEVDFWQSPAGREHLQRNVSYPLQVAPDGKFRAEAVAPNQYTLLAILADTSIKQQVTVPEAREGDTAPVDLGTLAVPTPKQQSFR